MWMMRAEEQAQRLGGIASLEEFAHFDGVDIALLLAADDIKAMILRVVAMGDFANGRDFISQRMQHRR